MATTSRHIPEAVKREVRQRCGFGCVICGLPLYEYDHIERFAEVDEHTANNITLLCGHHHGMKSRGQLPTAVVRDHDSKPHNRRTASPTHRLFYYGSTAKVVAGGNHIVMSESADAITIDGHSLIGFELIDGVIHLNVDLRDDDGRTVLRIIRNELVHSIDLWDVTFVGNRLTVRRGPKDIYVSMSFEVEHGSVVVDQGLVSHNGVEVLFDHRGLCVLNNRVFLGGNMVAGMKSAISLGDSTADDGPVAIHISISREPFDREEALRWASEELRRSSTAMPATSTRTPASGVQNSALYGGGSWAVCMHPLPMDPNRKGQ